MKYTSYLLSVAEHVVLLSKQNQSVSSPRSPFQWVTVRASAVNLHATHN